MQPFSEYSGIRGYKTDMPQGRPSTRQRNDFGKRLFELREAAGLTQADMAQALEITQQTYSDLERTPVTVSIERLKQLAQILGTTVSELVGEAPSKRAQGPKGKLNQVFESVSQLPRRQQNKVAEWVEAFVNQQAS
jgi:transcriptional regulator with XRE-family HTH domain